MAQLDDPRIVKVYDSGKEGRSHYMVMEYIEGDDLSDTLRRFGPVEQERAIAVGCEILQGLARIHDAGIVHRDIKPSNIMLTSDGHAKIADFGIALYDEGKERLTRTSERLGTTDYMAPETVAGGVATVRSDLYSFAVLLWELITGELPASPEEIRETGIQAMSDEIKAVLIRGLALSPDERFEDAAAFENELRKASGAETFDVFSFDTEDFVAARLSSHFREVNYLGAGGMGIVFKAIDPSLERTVAIKALSPLLKRNHESLVRFRREARATARLDHPGIIKIFNIVEDDIPFFVMEYLEGRTIREEIALKHAIAPERALRIVRAAADALDYAHSSGVIHRDIKGDNIFLRGEDRVTIMDFGLAKLEDTTQLTRTGQALGTLAYMSPEQRLGEEIDGRSDIFSLAVLLYEMLAGRKPFGPVGVMSGYRVSMPDLPGLGSRLKVKELIDGCLRENPDERPSSMGDVVRALDALME